MKRLSLILFSLLAFGNMRAQTKQQTFPVDVMLKKIAVTKDTVVVLAFWSVWFEESTKALDAYEELNTENTGKNVKVVFCNLDFNYNQDTLVKPFLLKHNFKSKLWHVSESDPDKWKDKIDTSWTGGFPAVVAYYNGKKLYFKEGAPDVNTLKQAIATYLK